MRYCGLRLVDAWEGTPIYVLGRYVLPPKRVWFLTVGFDP